jgi:hypothetical protein
VVSTLTLDGQTSVRGKCQYWRECMNEDDRWENDVKPADKRVKCSCFIEGLQWDATVGDLPGECPEAVSCRYHVKTW